MEVESRTTTDEHSALEDSLSLLQCVLVARRTNAAPEPINWQQYDILEMLRLHGSMTPSELSESLAISRPSASKALRVLKDLEFVEQAVVGQDRREQTTTLTTNGRLFLARAAQSRRDNAIAAHSVLTTQEVDSFVRMCRKVADAIAELPQE